MRKQFMDISLHSMPQISEECCTNTGRVDAQKPDATDRLPGENFSAAQLKQAFQQQGLTVQEFVALAGAHTVSSQLTGFCTIYHSCC